MTSSISNKMPVLFIGHGSPMNAKAFNNFTKHLSILGNTIPKPKKILMISAHWMTSGTKVQAIQKPHMVYDFYGFPEALSQINYPATGDLDLSNKLASTLTNPPIEIDHEWGFDHGAWSILHHMYPAADIPVVQLSLNQNFMNLRNHFELATQLKKLRNEGVLIIGSGNIVHNLRKISRQDNPVMEWANDFDQLIKFSILNQNTEQLFAEDPAKHHMWKMAHPSIEHYLPLLYVLGAADKNEEIVFPYEAFELGSLSMRSVLIG